MPAERRDRWRARVRATGLKKILWLGPFRESFEDALKDVHRHPHAPFHEARP